MSKLTYLILGILLISNGYANEACERALNHLVGVSERMASARQTLGAIELDTDVLNEVSEQFELIENDMRRLTDILVMVDEGQVDMHEDVIQTIRDLETEVSDVLDNALRTYRHSQHGNHLAEQAPVELQDLSSIFELTPGRVYTTRGLPGHGDVRFLISPRLMSELKKTYFNTLTSNRFFSALQRGAIDGGAGNSGIRRLKMSSQSNDTNFFELKHSTIHQRLYGFLYEGVIEFHIITNHGSHDDRRIMQVFRSR